MIPNYIKQWLQIIDEMQNDNTYKLAFGRALIENIAFKNYVIIDNKVIIDFNDISKCMLKYYWNQIFYFNLKQSPYLNKEPIICKDTKKLTCTDEDVSSDIKKISDLSIKVKDKQIKDMTFTVDMIFPKESLSQRQSYMDEIRRTKPYMDVSLIDSGIRIVTEMEDGSFIGIDAGQEITISELKEVLEIQGYTCK